MLEACAAARDSQQGDYLARLRAIHAGAVRGRYGRGRRSVERFHRHPSAQSIAKRTSDQDLQAYIHGPGVGGIRGALAMATRQLHLL